MYWDYKVLKGIAVLSIVLFLFSLSIALGSWIFKDQQQTRFSRSESFQASAIVLVNQHSPRYSDFQAYIQPYLDHFGVPYSVLDISMQAVGPEIGTHALIIVGHRGLDLDQAYLNIMEQRYITAAVNAGTGLVNFDNELSSSGSFRYQFIQDIFEFDYVTPTTGEDITFVTVNRTDGILIDCTADDHQDPMLTTFTDPALLNKQDDAWDEYLWKGYRDYAAVFGGTKEAAKGDLEMIHFHGEAPNGTYRVFANLFHSRDWRYFWGYSADDPRAYSIDVTSGPAGDFAEFELGIIKITDSHFDLYTDYGQDLGGKSFPYFGWAWIRLVPIDVPPLAMHFITERHQNNETIGTKTMTLAGIRLPDGVETLAKTVSQPFLSVTTFGLGNAVQWGTYDWMSHAVKGPVSGLDDLVWRSLVWAARKPFVMQGMPNLVTMRVDDESGPFGWIEIANDFGIKPWAGLFLSEIDSIEARQLSTLVNSGNATTSIHAKGELDFFYYDHDVGDFPDDIITENFSYATYWHATHNIPISKIVIPHFYELGTNAFQGLGDWGVEFIGTVMELGSGYSAPWIMNGPYRLYEERSSKSGFPTFYADYMNIPGYPEFDGRFFNCITEIRDESGYEWFPSNDVSGSISRGVNQTKRALDSMVIAT